MQQERETEKNRMQRLQGESKPVVVNLPGKGCGGVFAAFWLCMKIMGLVELNLSKQEVKGNGDELQSERKWSWEDRRICASTNRTCQGMKGQQERSILKHGLRKHWPFLQMQI